MTDELLEGNEFIEITKHKALGMTSKEVLEDQLEWV